MHYRSHTTRSHRAGSARLAVAAVLLLVAGCQNNSERDLIARDRRMQEDQVYAMQDYIQQYQQLVCRYRTENATLKRQLAEGYEIDPNRVEPGLIPQSSSGIPATKKGPQFESPQTPGSDRKQPPLQQPEIEVPDVPPLKSTTWNDADRESGMPASEVESQDESAPRVLATSYEAPLSDVGPEVESNVAEGASKEENVGTSEVAAPTGNGSAPNVLISGEVVANDAGGGPRLMIDVEPFDKSGRVEAFDGHASVMLLEPGNDGRPRSLGRWDFGPNDVRSAIDPSANEPNMRFYVELSAGTTVGESTELWVRLVPNGGAKLLAHASVDLTRPGVFSSRTDRLWPAEESVVATSYVETAAPTADVAATLNEGNWAIAAPGKPANLPQDLESTAKGWRMSSEPPPAVMAADADATLRRNFGKSNNESRSSRVAAAREPAKRPGWSPDRADDSARRISARPSWSATR